MSIEIKVCMGSACHIKGAPKIAQAFDEELRARGLDERVKLMGSFCRKMCIDGVNVEVNNVLYSHVTVDDVKRLVDIAMGVEVRNIVHFQSSIKITPVVWTAIVV